MSRVQDRQPYVRVAVGCGALGSLFLFVAARMLVDGARLVDELWALVVGAAMLAIAVFAVRRHLEARRHEALMVRGRARARSPEPR